MAAPTLQAQAIGWHGKLPCRGDFVGRGLPAAWQAEWHDALQRSLAQAEGQGGRPLRDRLAALAPWQALVLPRQPGQPTWLLLLLPSHDSVGRAWPLLVAEAHRASALDSVGLAALRARGRQVLGLAQPALTAASPQAFDQALAVVGNAPWRAAAGHGAADTVAQWRRVRPQAASFWWPLQGADLGVPRGEAWPPGDFLLPQLLGA